MLHLDRKAVTNGSGCPSMVLSIGFTEGSRGGALSVVVRDHGTVSHTLGKLQHYHISRFTT